jgi:major membrane immunogen (membrane-anchored lipoprotein)
MHKCVLSFLSVLSLLTSAAFASVNVSAPSKGATVQSPVHYAATAGSTSCSKGVSSMGIYTEPGVLAYVTNGTSLSTDITLSPGTYNTTVEQWDYCGGASTTPVTITVSSGSSTGVFVTSPANNSTVGSPVHFAATATTSCSKGVSSMGIYTAPYQKAYTVSGASLSTDLTLSSGTYTTTVEEWDRCGGASTTPVTITVSGGSTGTTMSGLQASKGWTGYGELPPSYNICSSCGSGVTWSMSQKITSPSLDSKATKFNLGGTTPYADVLWNNHLIGDGSSQGLLDSDHKLVPTLHNFTYDTYFYGTNLSLAENLEFDIAQFVDDKGFMFGTQCQMQANGSVWGIWDPLHAKWVSTSAPCKPNSDSWNHAIIKVQRTSSDQLLYQSITLNGVTTTLNKTYSPFSAPGWWGVVINFQLDGNYNESDYSVYLDKLNFNYY